jgi:hypothetical protein
MATRSFYVTDFIECGARTNGRREQLFHAKNCVVRGEIISADEKGRQSGGLLVRLSPSRRESIGERLKAGRSTPVSKYARSAHARRLHRRQRGLDATPIRGCLAIAFGFTSGRPLCGLQHGALAAHLVKLSCIVQDFESLHHRISMRIAVPGSGNHQGKMRGECGRSVYFFGMPIL